MLDLALELFELFLEVADAQILIQLLLLGFDFELRYNVFSWLVRLHCLLTALTVQ